jgi:hypothetical protein
MKRYDLLLVLLFALELTMGRATGQQNERPILVGTGKGGGAEELSQVYAIDAKIVNTAYETTSPLLARAFITSTTQTDCCSPAVKVGSSCWRCCDSTWVCTDDARYSAIVERTTKVSEKEWLASKEKGLNSISGWSAIAELLRDNPPLQVSKNDPRVAAFLKNMYQK